MTPLPRRSPDSTAAPDVITDGTFVHALVGNLSGRGMPNRARRWWGKHSPRLAEGPLLQPHPESFEKFQASYRKVRRRQVERLEFLLDGGHVAPGLVGFAERYAASLERTVDGRPREEEP